MAITGVAEAEAAIARLVVLAGEGSKAIVTEAQALVESTAKKSMSTAHPAGTPTPSSPGSPPSVVSGTLRRSIMSDSPTVTSDGGAVGHVFSSTVYSRIQELGGSTGRNGATTLPPRPYMQPAYTDAQDKLGVIATQHWAELGG